MCHGAMGPGFPPGRRADAWRGISFTRASAGVIGEWAEVKFFHTLSGAPWLFLSPAERPSAFVKPGILLHHLARAGKVVSRRQNRVEHRCSNQEAAQRGELGGKQRIEKKP